MPLRIGSSLRIAAGLLAGLLAGLGAGVMVSAGAASSDPRAENYEIVRSTFSGGGESAEGTAMCSKGKLVMGGGGRVLDEGIRHYAIVASDPLGPSGWSVTFVRHPEAESRPILPGGSAQEEAKAEFEVTAVCATVH
jgi:hypothetical protein